jgi:hypothetical protein
MKTTHYCNGRAVRMMLEAESVIEKIKIMAAGGEVAKGAVELSIRQFCQVFDYNSEYIRKRAIPGGLPARKLMKRWFIPVPKSLLPMGFTP